MILRGMRVEELRALVADAVEPILRPLVYREPLDLLHHHRERGEPVYIVSATLQEIVDAVAADHGFDGAIGTICEVVDGVYTGRSLRPCHAEGKARAVRELAAAENIDLERSTAYSDSPTDIPFLEVVGNPVAVNPDRALRRAAMWREWPILEFGDLAYSQRRRGARPAVYGVPLLLGAGAAVWAVAKHRRAA